MQHLNVLFLSRPMFVRRSILVCARIIIKLKKLRIKSLFTRLKLQLLLIKLRYKKVLTKLTHFYYSIRTMKKWKLRKLVWNEIFMNCFVIDIYKVIQKVWKGLAKKNGSCENQNHATDKSIFDKCSTCNSPFWISPIIIWKQFVISLFSVKIFAHGNEIATKWIISMVQTCHISFV